MEASGWLVETINSNKFQINEKFVREHQVTGFEQLVVIFLVFVQTRMTDFPAQQKHNYTTAVTMK